MRDVRARRRRAVLAGVSALLMGWVWQAAPLRADVVITEIHYDPTDLDEPGVPRQELEFVELYNDGPEAYDLSNFFFTRGISLVLPPRTFIEGRGYLVVCRDEAAVRDAYGIADTVGDFTGSLDNSGETVELANPQGRPVTSVQYNDRGQWPSAAKGTGHSLSISYEYLDPTDADSWELSTRMGGTPGRTNFLRDSSFEETTLIPDDAVWRYFRGTRAPPGSWRDVDFDDSSWESGRTGIGYGDGDDRTVLGDMGGNYLTVFCRRSFDVDSPDDLDDLVLRLVIDDGYIAWLNGTEIGRANVTGEDFDDSAASAGEPETYELGIPAGRVEPGENVLAVQVHNGNLDSSDLSFIPELVSRREIEPEGTARVPVDVNEGHFPETGRRFVELYNDGDEEVDLSGYWLTNRFEDLQGYRIPDGTTIAPRGFLVLDESGTGLELALGAGSEGPDRLGVALSVPGGDRVVDSRIFEVAVEGFSEARFPDGDEKFAPAAVPTPGEANRVDVVRDVVINEVMYHPISESADDEWVELYNRGDVAHDLSGWELDGTRYTFPEGTVIGPGEYLVVARSPEHIREVYGLDASVVIEPGFEGRLRDGGEKLELVDLQGNVASRLRYEDGGEWAVWTDGYGSSLERIDPFGANSDPGNWDASDDSDKAETQTFTYTARHGGGESDLGMMLMTEGIAIVDDVSVTRSGSNSNLVANGTFDSDLRTWRTEGTHIHSGQTSDPDERITGGGSLKLICWNGGGDYKVNRIECDTGRQSGALRVSFKARWVVGSRTLLTIGDYNVGQPDNAGIARSHQLEVPERLGTPGAMNSASRRQMERFGQANSGPAISGVEHEPGVPVAGESVTVTARVRDPDGVAEVDLFWRAEDPRGNFARLPMDGPDPEGRYRASIPGQSLGTRVLFFVSAADDGGRRSRFPRDILQATHPPVVDRASAAANDELYCLYRHDQRLPSTDYHSYRFILDEQSENELRSRRVLSNHAIEGTFVFGSGDVYYNAKIRFAGSPWLRPSGGSFDKSYTIKMPKDDPLHGRKRTFNLDEHGRDGRERVAHYLLRLNAAETALPYFDGQALVRFQLNDVETGTYEALDKPNTQYMDFWFPDDPVDGALFEMDDRFSFNDSGSKTGNAEGHVLAPPYGPRSNGEDKENYRWYFALRERKGEDDFRPIMQLCQALDPEWTPNSLFDSLVFNVVDVEEVLRVWAIRLNIDDWDTWGGRRGKNCYFYRSSADGKWRLIPWDLELTFGDANAFSMPSTAGSTFTNHFEEVQRMLNRPRVKRMYYAILDEQVDRFFHAGAGSPLSAWASELAGSGVDLGNTLSYVEQRGRRIESWIRGSVYPQVRLEITTNEGEDLTTDRLAVTLEGTAPADVWSIALVRNGELLEGREGDVRFSNRRLEEWSVRAPLVAGENRLEVLGFERTGGLLDSDEITVTSRPPFGRPVITSVEPETVPPGGILTILGEEFHEGLEVIFSGSVVVENPDFDESEDPGRIRVEVPGDVPGEVVTVEVENSDGQRSEPAVIRIGEAEPSFLRGDSNLDGAVDISDAIATLDYLFAGAEEVTCLDALDADDTGAVDITDAIVTLNFLFQGGEAPPPPYPGPGTDPTADDLGCQTSG